MNKSKNIGISLIVLVITIVVIVILAGAVVLALSDNNPITQANKATYLSDVRNFQSELQLYETKQFTDQLGSYNPKLLQADGVSITYDGVVDTSKTINNLIPTLGKTTKYTGQFEVIDGELVFQGSDNKKQEWTKEIGIEVVIVGEPRINVIPPVTTVVVPGTDVTYSIKFSSNASLTTIDLTDKVEVLDDEGVALSSQPAISIGTVSGTSENVIRYADVTIKTDTLVSGSYKLKIKSNTVTNSEGKFNSQDIISLIGFDVLDNIPPENPNMSAEPTEWTNENVTISIVYSDDSVVKEYSLDTETWNSYTSPVVVNENNVTVYARGKDASQNESGVATLTVSKIDKIAPTVTASNGGSTSSSVTVTAVASDEGGSEILISSYQYSKDNGSTWTEASSETSYTFSTLTTGTYQCKVKVIDNAGNITISNVVAINTTELGAVTLVASPTIWTNGDVAVTITYPIELVTKQYSLDGTTWNTYIAPVTVTSNNTTVYAKGLDVGGNQTVQATLTVSKIDKIAPTVTASNGGATSSSVIVTAVASDTGGSGLVTSSYQYSKDNGTTWTTATSATSYTFNTLTTGTYQCKVKVIDNAGNTTISNAVPINTSALGTVTLVASPTAWTNGNVSVTITYPAAVVTKQYSLNGTTWNTYTAPVVVSTNGTTVYAKGLDAGGNQTVQATLTVTNIDKINPVAAWGTPSKTTMLNNESTTIPLTFTETMSGIKNSTVNITNITIQKVGITGATVSLSGSENNWTATINGISGSGSFTLTATTAITDNSNNILNSNVVSTSIVVNPSFTTVTFTNAGAAGRYGPTQEQLNSAYSGTPLASTVTSSSGIQLWNVPQTGTYRIETYGAQGANNGGLGAIMKGDFALTQGTQLRILVGQIGIAGSISTYSGGGGGGGTFVANVNTPLIISGGGGGYTNYGTTSQMNASTGNNGLSTYNNGGGINGYGGGTGQSDGPASGGGGFYGNGTNGGHSNDTAGLGFLNGGIGGTGSTGTYSGGDGGFGGGGGGMNNSYTRSGGAGGFSGGQGGSWTGQQSGGGGGSYNTGTNQANTIGNTGNGKVIIIKIN